MPYIKISLFLATIVLFGAGCTFFNTGDNDQPLDQQPVQDQDPVIDRDAILQDAIDQGLLMNGEEVAAMKTAEIETPPGAQNPTATNDMLTRAFKGWHSAALADVTGGSSYGLAFMQYENDKTELVARLGNLPEPGEGSFYEGWLVQRGENMRVINTGKTQTVGEMEVSTFTSDFDLTDYDFFVVTLEPNDDDPAPSEHILEGQFN